MATRQSNDLHALSLPFFLGIGVILLFFIKAPTLYHLPALLVGAVAGAIAFKSRRLYRVSQQSHPYHTATYIIVTLIAIGIGQYLADIDTGLAAAFGVFVASLFTVLFGLLTRDRLHRSKQR